MSSQPLRPQTSTVNRRLSHPLVPAETPAAAPRRIGRRAALGMLAAAGLGVAGWKLWPRTPAAPAPIFVEAATTSSSAAVAPAPAASILDRCIAELEAAEKKLAGVNDMTAVFLKQEQLDGTLGELNRMELKVRKEPLAAYMKWQSQPAGREVLWVKDANDGMMLVQPGGLGALLVKTIKVDPLGDLALSSSRRPITEIGIWHMTSELLKHARAAKESKGLEATLDEVEAEGAKVRRYTFKGQLEQTKGRLVMFFDKDLAVPLGHQVFEHTDEGEQMVESYLYVGLKLDVGLKDMDFSTANPAYKYGGK